MTIVESVTKNITRRGQNRIFFVPASRSLITSILPAAQSKFIAEIDNRSEDNQIDYFVKTFLEDIDFFKRNYFFGKSLDEVIDEFELKTGKENPQAKQLRDKIKTILKADYQHGNSGEVLVDKRFLKPVSLDKASSGQQEVVWILLTLLSLILEDNKSFVVIEEPEAHLYPKTQAQVVEYIAQFFNAKEGNEMIITTHSPYILTVLNNLLFAKQISVKTHGVENQAIAESIDPQAWLDINKFSAYYVGRNDEGQFIKSIINPETGLISVNALDDASDDIMDTFDNLMDIYKGAELCFFC
jgi:predicted ATPase